MTAKRRTPQKGIILDTLCRMGSHPTAGELYEEIHRSHPSISRSTVYRVLGQMEEDGLVDRKVYPEVPPRVEYSLTELGRSLEPVLSALWNWGETYQSKNAG